MPQAAANQLDDSAPDGWQISVGLGDKCGKAICLSLFSRLAWESSHGGDGQGSKNN